MLTEPESSPSPSPSAPAGEPDLVQPAEVTPCSVEQPLPRWLRPHSPRRVPSLADSLLLIVLAAAILFFTEIAAFALALGTHVFGHESPEVLLRDPRLLIPSMAISYFLAGALIWAIFARLWARPFLHAIRWNGWIVQRRFYLFLGLGVVLSVFVQFLSNYLPIPKSLPIDEFFRTPTDVWMVAVFGTLIAPVFEELAFRGFIFPSLASVWDRLFRSRPSFVAGGSSGYQEQAAEAEGSGDPEWSVSAIVFSSILTSIGFALLHADQLAHSWMPLSVLFSVSIVLCMVRLHAHSLAASALVHATYNGTIFALLFYATDGFRHLDKMSR